MYIILKMPFVSIYKRGKNTSQLPIIHGNLQNILCKSYPPEILGHDLNSAAAARVKKSCRLHKHPVIPKWVFPKIGIPQNGWFIMENPIKMDDLGVPLFSETPKWRNERCFFSYVFLGGAHLEHNLRIYGCFRKWWYPQNTPK